MKTRAKNFTSIVAASVTLLSIALLVIGMGQACSNSLPADTSAAAATPVSSNISAGKNSTLELLPSLDTIAVSSTLQMTATGGTPPYLYSLGTVGGSIVGTTGLYTAPLAAANVSVVVTDATGSTAYAVLIVH